MSIDVVGYTAVRVDRRLWIVLLRALMLLINGTQHV